MSSSSQSCASSTPLRRWPTLTLYGDLNMRPMRNAWMLEEIGLPWKHKLCMPWSRVAKGVHPLGKVPALLVECENDEGVDEASRFTVVESAAINTFVGDLAREISDADAASSMLVPPPATPLRAKYDALVLFCMTELDAQALWIQRKHGTLTDVFGESAVAVKEARRQFDNALEAMMDELPDEESYLLPSGFSAADVIFANCCFWAQQIEWLEREPGNAKAEDGNETNTPHPLTPKLAAYLARCRARSAFRRANAMRKNQVYSEKEKRLRSKL